MMELALQQGAQLVPVPLQNGVQVIVIVPVGGNLVIDGPGLLVEDLRRVAVRPDRAIDRLPDVELLSRAPVVAQGSLVGDVVAHRDQGLAQVVAHGGLLHLLVRTLEVEDVWLLVEVDGHVGMKVDRVRAGDKGAVVVRWDRTSAPPAIPTHPSSRHRRSAPSRRSNRETAFRWPAAARSRWRRRRGRGWRS